MVLTKLNTMCEKKIFQKYALKLKKKSVTQKKKTI